MTPDPIAILEHLGWSASTTAQPLLGGWDNHLWRFGTADGRVHVLRMYRNSGPKAIAQAANEAAAMDCARQAGLAVPVNEAVGDVDGVPVFIQQLMPGVPLVDAVKRRPWQLASLARQFGAMQARIHSIAPPPSVRRLGVGEIRTVIDDGPLAEAGHRGLSDGDAIRTGTAVEGRRVVGLRSK